MALRILLVLFFFGCALEIFAQDGSVDFGVFNESGAKPTMTIVQQTSVLDNNLQEVTAMNMSLTVWGSYDREVDKMVLMDFVMDKITYMAMHPDMFMMNQDTGEDLPLQGVLTAAEVIQVGPQSGTQSSKAIGVRMNMQLYSKVSPRMSLPQPSKHLLLPCK